MSCICEDCISLRETSIDDYCELSGHSINREQTECSMYNEVGRMTLEQAKKVLSIEGYLVVKYRGTAFEKDTKECEMIAEMGKDKDCLGCACSVCLVQVAK